MIQQSFRLMLVFALLTNQVAVCSCHAHHESNPADSSVRPHFHLTRHSHDGDSSHHHVGSGVHRHTTGPSENTCPDLNAAPISDHESDAVYFGDQGNLLIQSNQWTHQDLCLIPVWIQVLRPTVAKTACSTPTVRAGPFGCRCAVFLQTSHLLI